MSGTRAAGGRARYPLAAPFSRRALFAAGLGLLAAGCRPTTPSGLPRRGYPSGDAPTGEAAGIHVTVPFAVGGPTDLLVRLLAEYWPVGSPQPLLVHNVTGSNGTIGAREVLSARPDGTTLLATHESLVTAYHLGLAGFNWTDFEPIACLFYLPELIVTRPDRPWYDTLELLEDARRRPEKIRWASTFGSRSHFVPGAIMCRAGAQFKLVGYEGSADCLTALVTGEVDVANAPLGALQELLRGSKLRVLGVPGSERAMALPEVPTLREQGVDVALSTNVGLFAPKATTAHKLATLETAAGLVLADSDVQQRALDEAQAQVRFLPRARYADHLARLDATVRLVTDTMGLRA